MNIYSRSALAGLFLNIVYGIIPPIPFKVFITGFLIYYVYECMTTKKTDE